MTINILRHLSSLQSYLKLHVFYIKNILEFANGATRFDHWLYITKITIIVGGIDNIVN